MTKQVKVVKEESAAAATLKPNPSRAQMLSTFTQMLAQLGMEDLTHFFNDAIAQIGQEAVNIPDGAAAKNAATIAAKEDIEQIFAGQELSEEFKTKAQEIFEALLDTRVQLRIAELDEQYEAKLAEEAENVVEQITETLDQYLNYVASEWLKENEVEIEHSLRTEISESLLEGLYNVFKENNIKVPEGDADVVEQLTTRVEELESALEEQTNKNIELTSSIEEAQRNAIFDEVAEGLVATQVEKFRALSEGIEYTDDESFKRKLNIVKESHFTKKLTEDAETEFIKEDEEVVEVPEPPKNINDPMERYASAISRNLKQ
jgi:AcrR family transcriptional regulator